MDSAYIAERGQSPALKWPGAFPVVMYKIDASAATTAETRTRFVQIVQQASALWSFKKAGSRMSYEYSGQADGVSHFSPGPDHLARRNSFKMALTRRKQCPLQPGATRTAPGRPARSSGVARNRACFFISRCA
jgi:hypothetical protein